MEENRQSLVKEALGNVLVLKSEESEMGKIRLAFKVKARRTIRLCVLIWEAEAAHTSFIVDERPIETLLEEGPLPMDRTAVTLMKRCYQENTEMTEFFWEVGKYLDEKYCKRLRYEHIGKLTPIKNELPIIVDKLIRQYLSVITGIEKPMSDYRPGIPTISNDIRQIAQDLKLTAYSLTCTETVVSLRADFHYYDGLVATLQQVLIIQCFQSTRAVNVKLRSIGLNIPAGGEKKSSDIENDKVKLVGGELIVSTKNSIAWTNLKELVAETIALYWSSMGQLVAEDIVRCRSFPLQRRQILVDLLQRKEHSFATLLQELPAYTQCDSQIMDRTRHSHPHIYIAFPSDTAYFFALSHYRLLRSQCSCRALSVGFQRIQLLPDENSILVDTSNLKPLKDNILETNENTLAVIYRLAESISEIRACGCAVENVLDCAYLVGGSKEIMVLPISSTGRFSILKGSMQSALTVLISEIRASAEFDPVFVNIEGKGRLHLADAVLHHARTQLASVENSLCNGINFVKSTLSNPENSRNYNPLSLFSAEGEKRYLVFNCICGTMKFANDENISHLFLTPNCIQVTNGLDHALIRGFKSDLAMIEPHEAVSLEFIDTNIVNWMWYARRQQAEKMEKYGKRVDASADVYSLAMIAYCLLFNKRPFEVLPEDASLEDFYAYVIKPHRIPPIPADFERQFPEFTDLLRRSWCGPRPSMLDLSKRFPRNYRPS